MTRLSILFGAEICGIGQLILFVILYWRTILYGILGNFSNTMVNDMCDLSMSHGLQIDSMRYR